MSVAMCAAIPSFAAERFASYGGIYPHLAMFNDEGECGTGAVVPWAGDLWVVTYAPHAPMGSSDKLYRIHPDLTRETFPGSVGSTRRGTCAWCRPRRCPGALPARRGT